MRPYSSPQTHTTITLPKHGFPLRLGLIIILNNNVIHSSRVTVGGLGIQKPDIIAPGVNIAGPATVRAGFKALPEVVPLTTPHRHLPIWHLPMCGAVANLLSWG